MAEYGYANNDTEIQFVNNQLDGVLTNILNDTSNLNKISQAFNANVVLNTLTFQPPEIKSKCSLSALNIHIWIITALYSHYFFFQYLSEFLYLYYGTCSK